MKNPINFRARSVLARSVLARSVLARSVLACTALSALLLASSVAAAGTPACDNARMDWQDAFHDKDMACSNDGPNSASCAAAESLQYQAMQAVDMSCPPLDDYCQGVRSDYDTAAQNRSFQCSQAGSSSAPQCMASRNAEFQQLKRLIRECMSL